MFALQQPQPNRRQQARIASTPAPVGGWNARDALADMPPTDAVTMDNWFPRPSYIEVRKGYSAWSTGYANPVETLMLYEGDTQEKLFAASGTAFYDASSNGAVGAAVVSGLTNARWIYTNFTTSSGARWLIATNGVDAPRVWDSATWVTVTGASTPAMTFTTGAVPANMAYVTTHKSRVWCSRVNTMEVYYSPVGGLGAMTLFDLRAVFKRGGTITAMETWSIDGGYGLDDHLVFLSSNGEVAIYRGTDPSSASTWSIIGLYFFSAPIGYRPLFKYGGDLLVLCYDGLLPLSQSLQSSRVNTKTSVTDKIQSAMSASVGQQSATYGWQMTTIAPENALIVNIPQGSGVFYQYVMNTITGAWCRFKGWNASCWEVWKGNVFFGGPTYVAKAFNTFADNGSQITTRVKSAFNYFRQPGVLKQWTMARPVFATDGSPALDFGLNIDFDDADTTGVPSFVTSTSSSWDAANWDSGVWGGGLTITKNWQYVSGIGYCAALKIDAATNGIQLQLAAVDYAMKLGGVL